MRHASIAAILFLAACGGSTEENAAKDREAAKATWALVLKVDGADVRIPLEVMDVILFKDEDYAKQNPTVFQITGQAFWLFGEIPPANNVGYGENWEKLFGATLAVKPSGEFHRDLVTSRITLPGRTELKISGGSLQPDAIKGKWTGSEGNKTLSGKIKLVLEDGKTIEGTFSVHVVTWG
jgi:hypothetical protein